MSLSLKAQVFWSQEPTNFAAVSRGVADISYGLTDPNVVWITVYDGVTTTNVIQEYGLSLDGGLTWTTGNINLGDPTIGIATINAINATTAYVSVYNPLGGPGSGIWKTVNSGVTWTKQPTATFSTPDSFTNVSAFFTPQDGFTMGDPSGGYFEIYTTQNGGDLWTRVASNSIITSLPSEYGTVRNVKRLGNDVWFGTNKGRLFHSVNKGLTWTVGVTPLADTNSGAYAFSSSNNGILTDDGFNMWTTIDGGKTWTPAVPNGTIRDGGLCYVPGTTNSFVCLGVDGDVGTRGSSYSCDGGLNWTDINLIVGETNKVNGTGALNFASLTQGLAAGFNDTTLRGIFKYTGTQLAECQPSVATTSFSTSGYSIAPNPTNGLVELKGTNINLVVVTDMLGKVVSNNTYSSLSNVTIDMTSYNTGIYFVKVTNNEGTVSTAKVVKQ